jgi:hypothetical protein
MTDTELQIERATWVVKLKGDIISAGFLVTESSTATQTLITINHPSVPHWNSEMIVESVRGRNRILLDRSSFSTCSDNNRHKIREYVKLTMVLYRFKEDSAKMWSERQDKEIGNLSEIPGIDAQIITSGPNKGCYSIKLSPGNPLERLTLDQYKALHVFIIGLQKCSLTIQKV